MRRLVRRIASRWLRAGLSRTFNTWTSHVQQRKRHRELVHKMLQRMQHQTTAAALRTWKQHLHNLDAWELQSQIARLRRAREYEVAKRFLKRLANAKMAQAWQSWQEHRLLHKKIHRAAMIWMNRSLVRIIRTW